MLLRRSAGMRPDGVGSRSMDEQEFPKELTGEDDDRRPEQPAESMYRRIMDMGVADRIKLATLGNREARSLLIRDANQIVVRAVLNSPRLTEEEVIGFAANRNLSGDVPRLIAEKREFMKNYAVRLALIKNSKTPVPTSVKLIEQLREHDLRGIAKDRNISSVVSRAAIRVLSMRETKRG
jgi:hypothetical protein